jgi:hypothetical protein
VLEIIWDLLNQSWFGSVLGIIGVLIGVVGLAVAYYLYYASKIGARLVYQVKSSKLIGHEQKLPEEVSIHSKIKSPTSYKNIFNLGIQEIKQYIGKIL